MDRLTEERHAALGHGDQPGTHQRTWPSRRNGPCHLPRISPSLTPLEVEALRRHANLMRLIEAETRQMERFASARPASPRPRFSRLPTDVTDLATLRRVGALLADKD